MALRGGISGSLPMQGVTKLPWNVLFLIPGESGQEATRLVALLLGTKSY